MTEFSVDIQEIREFTYQLEAGDEDEARVKAKSLYFDDADGNCTHTEVIDSSVTNVEHIG